MVQLLLRLVATPGHADEIMQALRTVARPAQADRGCLWAQLYRADDNDCHISYVEEWADAAELNRQLGTERFGRLLAVLETAAEPPLFELRFINETRGLDYVAATRLSKTGAASRTH